MPEAGEEVDVGTWSGSVSDIPSGVGPPMLEKIKDVSVNHPEVGTRAGVGVEVETGVDGKGRPEVEVGKMMGVALLKSEQRNYFTSGVNTLGRRWNHWKV